MADYTDTTTYSVRLNGSTYSDTITETISTVTEVLHYKVHCGTAATTDALIYPTTTYTGTNTAFDATYLLVTNKDATQPLTVQMFGTDFQVYQIPPLGFMKFYWDGAGTYDQETTLNGTRVAFTDVTTVYGHFPDHSGLVEVLAINA